MHRDVREHKQVLTWKHRKVAQHNCHNSRQKQLQAGFSPRSRRSENSAYLHFCMCGRLCFGLCAETVTTRFCVGAMGAGVPKPCSAKRANESTSPGRPATISRIPTARVASRSKKGDRNSQRVIHQGTSPATELGATAKKRAEPNTANDFGTVPPSRPVAMLMQPCPVSAFNGSRRWPHPKSGSSSEQHRRLTSACGP